MGTKEIQIAKGLPDFFSSCINPLTQNIIKADIKKLLSQKTFNFGAVAP